MARLLPAVEVLLVAMEVVLVLVAGVVAQEQAPADIVVCPMSLGSTVPLFSVHQTLFVGWTSTNLRPPSTVSLVLASTSGSFNATVATGVANTGRFEWHPASTVDVSGLPAVGTTFSVVVQSEQVPGVSGHWGPFSLQTAGPLVAPEYPYGSATASPDSAFASDGMPLSPSPRGYRHWSLHQKNAFGGTPSVRSLMLIHSVALLPLANGTADLRNFRVGMTHWHADSTYFPSDSFSPTAEPVPDYLQTREVFSASSLPASSVRAGQWLAMNLPRPFQIKYDRGLLLEFSLNSDLAPPGGPAAYPAAGPVATFQFSEALNQGFAENLAAQVLSDPLSAEGGWSPSAAYPYSSAWATVRLARQVPKLRVVLEVLDPNAEQTDSVRQCGSPPLISNVVQTFRWRLAAGSDGDVRDESAATPAWRAGSATAVVEVDGSSYLVAFGGEGQGLSGPVRLNDLWIFDLARSTWVRRPAANGSDAACVVDPDATTAARMLTAPNCVAYHSLTATGGGRAQLFGGETEAGPASSGGLGQHWELDVAGLVRDRGQRAASSFWTRLNDADLGPCSPPNGTFPCATAAACGAGEVVVQSTAAGACCCASRVSVASLRIRTTSQHAAAASSASGTLYLFGGVAADASGRLIRSNQLVSFARSLLKPNESATGASFGTWDVLWPVGSNGTVAECTPAADGPLCLSGAAMVESGGALYLFGGSSGAHPRTRDEQLTNALFRYEFGSAAWTLILAPDCLLASSPQCRAGHGMALVGGALMIFGGLATGPSNDVWTAALTNASAWQPRTDYRACSYAADSTPVCSTGAAVSAAAETLLVFGGVAPVLGRNTYLNSLWAFRLVPFLYSPTGPVTAATSGGTQVTLQGRNFGGPNSTLAVVAVVRNNQNRPCQIVGRPASVGDRDQLVVALPAGIGANISVRVGLVDLSVWFSDPVTYYSYAAPVASDAGPCVPSAAPFPTVAGGCVRVRGHSMGDADSSGTAAGVTVTVGPYQCQLLTLSSTELLCQLPAGVGGRLPVSVDAAGQASPTSGAFVSFDPPQVSRFVGPCAGTTGAAANSSCTVSTLGGSPFLVCGTNLGSAPSALDEDHQVCFGLRRGRRCVPATLVEPVPPECGAPSPSSLQALRGLLPAGTGSDINVSALIGGQASGPAPERLAYSPPEIVRVVVVPGSTSGGGAVTILGHNFGPDGDSADAVVMLAGQPCAQTEWLGLVQRDDVANETLYSIKCTVPAGIEGAAAVSVLVGGQASSNRLVGGQAEAVYSPSAPVVAAVLPVPVYTGERVITIEGDNFGEDRAVVSVSFDAGDTVCGDVKVVDPHTRLSCSVDRGRSGRADLVVDVAGQRSAPFAVMFAYEPIDPGLVRIVSGAAGVVVLGVFVVFLNVLRYREHKFIKAASVLFSSIILLGAMVTASSVFFMDSRDEPGCTVGISLLAVGFTLTYSTLVLKNYRILRLFNNRSISANLLRSSTMLVAILSLVIVDLALLLPYSTVASCTLPTSGPELALSVALALKQVAVLAAGVAIAFKSRVIHLQEFNERVTLGYAVYNITVSLLVVLPVAFVLRQQVNSAYILRAVAILLITAVTVAIVFGSKFVAVCEVTGKGGDETTMNNGGTSLRSIQPSASRGRVLDRSASGAVLGGASGRLRRDRQAGGGGGGGGGASFHGAVERAHSDPTASFSLDDGDQPPPPFTEYEASASENA